MAAKNGTLRLRRLIERARRRDGSASRQCGGVMDAGLDLERGPSEYGQCAEYGLYNANGLYTENGVLTEYGEPLDEAERDFTTEAREILGLDQEPRY